MPFLMLRFFSFGLAAFGATVVVCGRTGAKTEDVAAAINAGGGQAWGVELDIRDDPLMGAQEYRLLAAPADTDVTNKYAA